MIEVIVRHEAGYEAALYGMSLSHSLDMDYPLTEIKITRAKKLAPLQGGHNKFLESLMLWVEVNAPRYWWQQADTYRLSTKQSESTMHTILKRELEMDDFAIPPPQSWLGDLNSMIKKGQLDKVKALLPEGFMQRRMWCMSYKMLQNIYFQRKNHKLKEWQNFLISVISQIDHPNFIATDDDKKFIM